MSNIVIATPILSDAGTVTASSQIAAAPVDNLQRMQPTDVWQSTGTTAYVEIDLGSTQSINLFALLFTNCTSSATWRVRAASSQANLISAPGYDSSTVIFSPWSTASDRRHGFRFLTVPVTQRWVRFDITDSGNQDGYIAAGRLYVANAYQPARNYEYGARHGFKDLSGSDRSSGGQRIVHEQPIIPMIDLSIVCNDRDEFYANTHRIQQLRGGSKDILIILDPDDTTNGHEGILYGTLESSLPSVHPRYNHYEQRYVLEGLI